MINPPAKAIRPVWNKTDEQFRHRLSPACVKLAAPNYVPLGRMAHRTFRIKGIVKVRELLLNRPVSPTRNVRNDLDPTTYTNVRGTTHTTNSHIRHRNTPTQKGANHRRRQFKHKAARSPCFLGSLTHKQDSRLRVVSGSVPGQRNAGDGAR